MVSGILTENFEKVDLESHIYNSAFLILKLLSSLGPLVWIPPDVLKISQYQLNRIQLAMGIKYNSL